MRFRVKHELGPRPRAAGHSFEARPAPVAGSYHPAAPAQIRVENASEQALAEADDVLDVAGAMRLLRIGRNTIYDLVNRNEIPHRRLGKQIRFSRAAIMRWFSSWCVQNEREGRR